MHKIRISILLIIFCLAVSGKCLAAGETLVIGICEEKPDVKSLLSLRSDAGKVVASTVFNSLLRYSPGSPNSVEPELAVSVPKPKMSGGKQSWTFTLRKGVAFHRLSGDAAYVLMADDVAFSLEMFRGSCSSGSLSGMRILVENGDRITLVLEKPLSPELFLPRLTVGNGFYVFSRNMLERYGVISGTGPFAFVSETESGCIELEANKSYFRGKPVIGRIRFLFSRDMSDLSRNLHQGGLDVMIPPADCNGPAGVVQDGGYDYLYFYNGSLVYLGFDLQAAPFSDKAFRKMLAARIDRDGLCKNDMGCERLYCMLPPASYAAVTEEEVARLGLDYGFSGSSAKMTAPVEGESVHASAGLSSIGAHIPDGIIDNVRQSLTEAGIDLQPHISGDGVMECQDNTVNLRLFSLSFSGNADALFNNLIGLNVVDEKYRYLIEASRRETSNGRQAQILKHAQIKMLSDVDVIPLVFIRRYAVSKKDLHTGYDSSLQPFFTVTEKTGFINSDHRQDSGIDCGRFGKSMIAP